MVLLVLASSTMFVSGALAQTGRLSAETARLRARSGASAGAGVGSLRVPAASSYDLVVLRVEFQPDSSRFTTGDGTFSGSLYSAGLAPEIDPLPHDAGYVEAHLAFLKDYVARVSDGQTIVRSHLLPDIVRVSGHMGAYSPTGLESGSDAELSKLAALVTEAWALAGDTSSLPALDPERTAFLMVHAGVGRDVELVGTILDKTPEDLPSLYMDSQTLDRLNSAPRPSINGIPVRHGLIVPRTETRQGFNFLDDASFLAEFSVNGLLAASFFNYLGVPDLFDTDSGESAIGPFGLMDGLGIFAYSGLFPPEPSAWTKYYLGWTEPVEMQSGDTIDLAYVGSHSSPVAKASISEAEYFLVENRQRDPEGDGVVLQVWTPAGISEHRFENGAPGFNSATVDDFPGGVVVSVDQYDFALPGGKDEDDVPLIGGALVWHIDERVIAEGLRNNAVNANPDRRGVDLEEADSAQDIGHPIGGFFGPSFHLGSPFDFYYEGNPVVTLTASGQDVRLYENRFAPDTYPSSASNGGGASSVELHGFSTPGATMSVAFRRVADSDISLVDVAHVGLSPGTFSQAGLLRQVGTNASLAFSSATGQLRLLVSGQEFATIEGLSKAEPAILAQSIWAVAPDRFIQILDSGVPVTVAPIPAGMLAEATTPVVPLFGARGISLVVGGTGSQGDVLLTASEGVLEVVPQSSRVIGLARVDVSDVVVVLADQAVLDGQGLTWRYSEIESQLRLRPQFGRDRRGIMGAVSDPASNKLHILLPDGTTETVSMTGMGSGLLSGTPALADLDNDGLLDVLVADQDNLWGFTRSGSVVNGFPMSTRARVVDAPIVVDHAQNPDIFTVIAMANDGQLDAYNPNQKARTPGFPLSVGVNAGLSPHYSAGVLTAISGDGYLASWSVPQLGELRSGLSLGNDANGSFVHIALQTTTLLDTPRILVPSEVYNWPNPVTGGSTRFRFIPTVECSISILIVDIAGNEIDKLAIENAPAEVPSEVEWHTSAGSGLYFARIRATTLDGTSEDSLVKVAIIR